MRRMDLDGVILRWKKTTRALKIHEQAYGRYLTDVLERVTDAQLVHFQDPVEAAAFFCMLDLVKKMSEPRITASGSSALSSSQECPCREPDTPQNELRQARIA